MPESPVNLNVERAARTGDSRLMTVKDLLEDMIRESEEYGWDRVVVALSRPGDGDEFLVDMRCAGCTTLEARGLMATWFGRGEMVHDDA